MADKPLTLEELARAEAAENDRRARLKKLHAENQERLRTEAPKRFYTLAKQVRDGVARFNGAAKLERVIEYTETAALTTRSVSPGEDLHLEVKREGNRFTLALHSMWRLRLPDALVIAGEGSVGVEPQTERFRLRIEGVFHEQELRWRITSDGHEVDTPIDEIADRLVSVVATGEIARLWTVAPFLR